MADFYVAANGSANNDGKSLAKAKATYQQAITSANNGSTIWFADGTYNTGNLNLKSGLSVRAINRGAVKIDATGYTNGFVGAASTATEPMKDVLLDGIEIYGAGAAVTGKFLNTEIRYMNIHDILGNGISINAKSDGIYIHHNTVWRTVKNSTEARSGISVLKSVAYPDANLISLDGDNWGIVIVDNIIYEIGHGMFNKNSADQNGIIFDRNDNLGVDANVDYEKYPRKTLIARNYVWGCGGCGIKIMTSDDTWVIHNTTYGNKQNFGLSPKQSNVTVKWQGEFQMQGCGDNITVKDNIFVGTTLNGGVLNMSPSGGGEVEDVINTKLGNTKYDRNLLYATVNNPLAKKFGSLKQTLPALTTNGVNGYFADNPQFAAAANTAKSTKERFALNNNSPAIGAASDGTNIGAWQGGGTTPIINIEVVTLPTLVFSGNTVGTSDKPYYPTGRTGTITPATFNQTPTSTNLIVQFYSSSPAPGSWNDLGVTLDGPNAQGKYTFTIPTTPGNQIVGCRIRQTFSGTGVSNGNSIMEGYIDIGPTIVSTDRIPEIVTMPVVSPTNPIVGSQCSVTNGVWNASPSPNTYVYQWKANNVNIANATLSTYTPVAGDKGKPITCAVTAINRAGSSIAAISSPTSAVIDPTDLTLSQVTTKVLAIEGSITTINTALAGQITRDNNQDKVIDDMSKAFGDRLDVLEADSSDYKGKFEIIDRQVASLAIDGETFTTDIKDLKDRLEEIETQFANFSVTGKVRLYIKSS